MKQFLYYMIGTTDYSLYAAEWAFALIGVILSLHLNVRQRDKQSTNTPVQFSWRFFFFDNFKRIGFTCLMLFVFLRFPEYLLQVSVVKENPLMILMVAFALGLANERLALWLKRIDFLGMNKTPVRKPKTTSDETPGADPTR